MTYGGTDIYDDMVNRVYSFAVNKCTLKQMVNNTIKVYEEAIDISYR